MESVPEIASIPPEITDIDRIKERLEREKFVPVECRLPGVVVELASVEYPEWYKHGQKLLAALDGQGVSDSELRGIAKDMDIDVDRILGIGSEDNSDTEAYIPPEFRYPENDF